MKYDLKKLHENHYRIHNSGTLGRGFGKTVYFAHCLMGYLDVLENEKILFFVDEYSRLPHILDIIEDVFKENNFEKFIFNKSTSTLRFKNNTNKVKFISMNSDNFRSDVVGSNKEIIPIMDLDNITPEYFEDPSIFKLIELKAQEKRVIPHINPKTGEYNLKFNLKDLTEDFFIPRFPSV